MNIRNVLLIGSSLIVLSGSIPIDVLNISKKSNMLSAYASTIRETDQHIIETEHGNFIISIEKIDEYKYTNYTEIKISGRIKNDTSREWSYLRFEAIPLLKGIPQQNYFHVRQVPALIHVDEIKDSQELRFGFYTNDSQISTHFIPLRVPPAEGYKLDFRLVEGIPVLPIEDAKIAFNSHQLMLKNLKFDPRLPSDHRHSARLTGNIENSLKTNIRKATIKAKFFDINGKLLSEENKRILDINPNFQSDFEMDVYMNPSDAQAVRSAKFSISELDTVPSYSFSLVKPIKSNTTNFSDSSLAILFTIREKSIDFVLSNKSKKTITIDWNKLSYIDWMGESKRIFHGGVRYLDRHNSLPPTTIPAGTTYRDSISIADTSYFDSSIGNWLTFPLLPPSGNEAKALNGRTIGLHFPLTIGATKKTYRFDFRIISSN